MSTQSEMLSLRIVSAAMAADDIMVFEFAAADGGELPQFTPGAHIDVEAAPGVMRQYSLCNAPTERNRYEIGVLREPAGRGGSAAMHALKVGSTLRVAPPRNHFELAPDARRSVLLAGGIGVTPLLCMFQHLTAVGADVALHYCVRSRSRAAFLDRIEACSAAHLHLDDGEPSQKLDLPRALGAVDPGTHVYVCGPAPFIDFVLAGARAQGLSEKQLHREYFAADPSVLLGEGSAFQVRLASSGRVLDVPEDKPVTDVLSEAGVDMPVSCLQGVCGTCLTRVLEGVPDHRDLYLTDEERAANDQFLPCCSRAKTPLLVLDL